jgi:signal transduction histidine kinase
VANESRIALPRRVAAPRRLVWWCATAAPWLGHHTALTTAILLIFPATLIATTWRDRVAAARWADHIDRSGMRTGDRVRDGLRRAVGDDRLEVFYRLADQDVYVNQSGAEAIAGPPARGLRRMWIHDPDEPVGSGPIALVEADAARRPPAARLRAALLASRHDLALARLDTVTEAAARRARTGDLEHRRDLEQLLHEQVQQRMSAVSMTLGRIGLRTAGDDIAAASVRAAQEEISVALAQLRTIATALHPPLLREAEPNAESRPAVVSVRIPCA